MTAVTINAQRLLADLHQLRSIGQCGKGVVRLAFTEEDMAARYWLKERFSEAGLSADIDGIGNVIGYSGNSGKALLMGSHSDTQPQGGWLDGAYGVIAALEVARTLRENPATAHLAVDVASWMDEEHTYHGFLGCQGFLGMLEDKVLEEKSYLTGKTLKEAINTSGLSGRPHRYQPDRYIGYLEAHIEQGPRLELAKKQIGVVSGIVGCRNFDVHFYGQMNHAGSTPMNMRRDAAMTLIHFGYQLDTLFKEATGEYTVWTIGRFEAFPGAASVVPEKAVMRVQFRDTSQSKLEQFEQILHQLSHSISEQFNVGIELERQPVTQPMKMDEGFVSKMADTAEKSMPGNWMMLPSAAVHDACMFAKVMPSAMLFVPSIGGISHSFSEDTDESNLVVGCQVLAETAVRLLAEQ
ncbi:hydantoinase/carbamoylase family amidase [Endozoicomonas sp. Mp262]|uniref:hydantoinase/carbamoylase family amidase n=1 Tax=Endozoicomonas sp. Mp262 TaxID=2919499 RepID=UPI0021DACB05